MARNKYPEETVEKILNASTRLFLEKGYDKTSIQDILNELDGLSKGAIYHHFKSKESILVAVVDRLGEDITARMIAIVNDSSLSGREKLKLMFLSSWKDLKQRQFIAAMPNLLKNPQLLAVHLNTTINDVVPHFILPVIRQGVKDGSLRTDAPLELSNVLMLLGNIWLNPLIYPLDVEDTDKKIALFNRILKALEMPTMDEGMREHISEVAERHKAFEE